MATFCEDCPKKGTCEGEVVALNVISTRTQGTISDDRRSASISFEYGVPQGPTDMTVVYTDGKGGVSEPVIVHGGSYETAEVKAVNFVDRVEDCTEPVRTKRLLGLITTRTCAAIE